MYKLSMETSISKFFSVVKDPRIDRKKLYPLNEILLVSLCCIISGGEGFEDMHAYGQNKLNVLRKLSPFENGIPSADTFARVFTLLDPKQFQESFTAWVDDLLNRAPAAIAIDGKLARRSHAQNQPALHMVSAWAHAEGLVLAQKPVKDKKNEISAIDELLEILDLKGAVVTIDAMGCQKRIAKKIKDRKGDYVFGLKDNHKKLKLAAKEIFEGKKKARFVETVFSEYETKEKSHGRLEIRKYRSVGLEHLPIDTGDWEGIESLVELTSVREIKENRTEEKRYYISSLKSDSKVLAEHIRGHWGIENGLHWVLDVTFNEDQSRVRKGQKNLALIRHASLNILKQDSSKGSIRGKRKKAGWNDDYLLSLFS